MPPPPKALIEAKPESPGRIVVIDAGRERHVPLTALAAGELDGLAAELHARGYQIEQLDADVEAQTPAHSPEAALQVLGLPPPYPALEAARTKSPPETIPAPS